MKLIFQADANLDPGIWRGLLRREPSIDFEGHVGVVPDAATDPDVLRLAANSGRVLVSADVKTMLGHFAEFISHENSPGLLLVPSSRSIGSVIDALLIAWLNWTPDQLRNQAVWLPRPSNSD